MKKINNKKLKLNKITISKLNDYELTEVNGGMTTVASVIVSVVSIIGSIISLMPDKKQK